MKFEKIYPRDIIAIVILGLLFACKLTGLNGLIDSMIALVVGYYFSKRVFEEHTLNVKTKATKK